MSTNDEQLSLIAFSEESDCRLRSVISQGERRPEFHGHKQQTLLPSSDINAQHRGEQEKI